MSGNVSRKPTRTTPAGGFIVRTYRLPLTTVEHIDKLCQSLGVGQSDLVSFLLENALDQVDTGQLKVPLVKHDIFTVGHKW
jgi:hypothetical protein